MLCLAEFIFSLLEWIVLFILDFNVQQSTLRTANQSCGQTLPTILVFVIYCSLLLFPSSPLEPNCLEYRNSFPTLANILKLCSKTMKTHGLGAQAGGFRRNCSISVSPYLLARSSGVSPRLKANLSPQDQNWVGKREKQLCVTLNLCFLPFPKWNFLNVERRNQIYFLPFVNIRSTKLEWHKFAGIILY